MATKKSVGSKKKSSSGSTPKSKRIVKNKMEKVMHEFKHHELKSGKGGKVKNPKQAIAIGLSEARRSGADIPPSPNKKKSAAKKKSSTSKKKTTSSRKKTAAKKTASKKHSGRKSATKKSSSKKK